MTCMDLTEWVNDTLGLEGENKYKEGKYSQPSTEYFIF